jgi:hypothetical protein
LETTKSFIVQYVLVLVLQTIEQELKDLAILRRKQIILEEVLKIACAHAVMLALPINISVLVCCIDE